MAPKQVRGKGGRKLGSKASAPASEHQRAVNRENASKPRIAVPADVRDALSDAKGRLGMAPSDHGIGHIEKIIEGGPAKSELFQWATDFAADRGGLPKRRETEIDAAADLPPMTILFANRPAPAAGTD